MRLLFSRSFEDARRYSESEIMDLPEYSLAVTANAYRLMTDDGRWIAIDNRRGLGETPTSRNVLHRGFVATMRLDNFRTLTNGTPDERHAQAAKFRSMVLEEGYAIASPFLEIDIGSFLDDEDGFQTPRIEGHEGRARSILLEALGIRLFPIHMLMSRHRNKNLQGKSHALLKFLNDGVGGQLGQTYRKMFLNIEV